jgi:cell division septation protein DedD
MDVGYFISELLGQHGNVSVPGLGYFAHTRVNGYYNEAEEKFYPPGYSVHFDARLAEDDSLSQYIADNKHISLASSKYFTEKYVANLKHLAATGKVAISNLGWFYTEDFKLTFKSNNELNTDPEFFGYPAIKMHRLGKQAAVSQQSSYSTTAAGSNNESKKTTQQFAIDQEHEDHLIALAKKKRTTNIILFIGLAALFTGLIYFLYNKYDRPALSLEEPGRPKADTSAKPANVVVVPDSANAKVDDTIKIVKFDSGKKKLVPQKDTVAVKQAATTVAPVVKDTIAGPHYEILGGSFSNVAEANTAIGNYKRMGFEAHILQNVPGRKRKVTLGSYATRAEAIAAQQKILATKKIKASSIYIQPYNIK